MEPKPSVIALGKLPSMALDSLRALPSLRIPVKVATQSTGKLPPKPVKAATPSERSDAGGLFLLYLVSCRQICLLFSE